MRFAPIVLLAALPALACTPNTGPAEPYAFVGSWDCGVAVFRFTNSTFDNGASTRTIRTVARDGSNYTLFMVDGSRIGLGLVTQTGLTWVSGTTGDQLNCRRVN